jgi:hypothetical protein
LAKRKLPKTKHLPLHLQPQKWLHPRLWQHLRQHPLQQLTLVKKTHTA